MIQTAALIGLLISCYGLYIQWKLSTEKKYSALCDISTNISCTKALGSAYGMTIGLPNSFYGVIFYFIIIMLDSLQMGSAVFYLACISAAVSLYLAYCAYIRQKNFCVLCTSIYIVNLALLALSWP